VKEDVLAFAQLALFYSKTPRTVCYVIHPAKPAQDLLPMIAQDARMHLSW